MNNREDLRERLLIRWEQLSEDDQEELLNFASELLNPRRLSGGPYDGLKVNDDQWSVNVSHGYGKVAVYDDFKFVKISKTGEGCMPDIRTEIADY